MKRTLRSQTSNIVAAALLALASATSLTHAASVTDANLFSGETVTSTSYDYGAVPAQAVDGTSAPTIFADYSTEWHLSISGFNSSVDSMNIYTITQDVRVSPGVTLYYSSSVTNSLTIGDYDGSAGTFSLNYIGTTTGTANQDQGFQLGYATISGLAIPTGTQSILFAFQTSADGHGPRINEIQGYAAVPEPSTVVLSFLGAALVVFKLSRNRRKVA